MRSIENGPVPLPSEQAADVIRYYHDNANRRARENNWKDFISLDSAAGRTLLESYSLLSPDDHGNIGPMLTVEEAGSGLDYLKHLENPSFPLRSERYYRKLGELANERNLSLYQAREILNTEEPQPPESSSEPKMLISNASPIRDDNRIPAGYSLFRREVRLLDGSIEPAFYSTLEGATADPSAWENSSSSVIEGFVWALRVPEFADHETEGDDRTQEIGNMISYAISLGLTEEQVLGCYRQAFAIAKDLNNALS